MTRSFGSTKWAQKNLIIKVKLNWQTLNLERFEVHGGPNYGLFDSSSPTFQKNLFFHTSLSFAKEQLAYHILILIYWMYHPVTDWEIPVKIIHCAVGVLTHSSVQIHNEKLTKICIWLTPRNWVVWDWQTFSVCVRAVHTISFYEFLVQFWMIF